MVYVAAPVGLTEADPGTVIVCATADSGCPTAIAAKAISNALPVAFQRLDFELQQNILTAPTTHTRATLKLRVRNI